MSHFEVAEARQIIQRAVFIVLVAVMISTGVFLAVAPSTYAESNYRFCDSVETKDAPCPHPPGTYGNPLGSCTVICYATGARHTYKSLKGNLNGWGSSDRCALTVYVGGVVAYSSTNANQWKYKASSCNYVKISAPGNTQLLRGYVWHMDYQTNGEYHLIGSGTY